MLTAPNKNNQVFSKETVLLHLNRRHSMWIRNCTDCITWKIVASCGLNSIKVNTTGIFHLQKVSRYVLVVEMWFFLVFPCLDDIIIWCCHRRLPLTLLSAVSWFKCDSVWWCSHVLLNTQMLETWTCRREASAAANITALETLFRIVFTAEKYLICF